MGVYINMEMPEKTYAHCMLIKDLDGSVQLHVCTKNSEEISEWEYFDLIPVPPHGRLIDADELRELYEEWENDKEAGIDIDKCHVPIPVIRQNIDDAPTVIEAEEG